MKRTKFDFSRPRKVEPPVENPNFSGLEIGNFEVSTGGSTLGSRPRKKLELRPFLREKGTKGPECSAGPDARPKESLEEFSRLPKVEHFGPDSFLGGVHPPPPPVVLSFWRRRRRARNFSSELIGAEGAR